MENLLLHAKGFELFGLYINLYGLIIAIGMVVAIFVVCSICKKRGFKTEDIYIVALYAIPLAIIGARLYYVTFSENIYTFWQVFEIWKGGLAIYGAVIGGALGVVLYCVIHKKNFLAIADIAVIGLILGQGIGRIGCYFADCCYGIEVTNESLQWFPLATQIAGVWHYSTFFYESFCDLVIFGILLFLIIKKINVKGIIMSLYFVFYGFARCIIETFRGDSLYFLTVKVSQILSLLLMVAGIISMVIIYTKHNKSKKVSVVEDTATNGDAVENNNNTQND